MERIDALANLLIWLIRAGAGCRIVYCLARMILADEEAHMYRRRARNMAGFYVLAELAWAIRDIVSGYFLT